MQNRLFWFIISYPNQKQTLSSFSSFTHLLFLLLKNVMDFLALNVCPPHFIKSINHHRNWACSEQLCTQACHKNLICLRLLFTPAASGGRSKQHPKALIQVSSHIIKCLWHLNTFIQIINHKILGMDQDILLQCHKMFLSPTKYPRLYILFIFVIRQLKLATTYIVNTKS